MGAARAGVPDLLAGLLRDRVDLAAVGAAVALAAGEREAALDGAARVELPLDRAVVDAHRVHGSVLGPEVDVMVDDDRRRLRAAPPGAGHEQPFAPAPTQC